ncbi:MAG: hypothetical protein JXA60_02125 [Candidatus Coatesbacteria bacterium]|nr:hypothetical protein [Candidatus Coatesbacteria bacterium]
MLNVVLGALFLILSLSETDTLKVEKKEIVPIEDTLKKTEVVKNIDKEADEEEEIDKILSKDGRKIVINGNHKQIDENIIPIIAIIMSLGIPIIAIIAGMYTKSLKTKERIFAMEKGLSIPMDVEPVKIYNPSRTLLKGLVILGIGLACFVTYFFIPRSQWGILLIGMAGMLSGASVVAWYFIAGRKDIKNDN